MSKEDFLKGITLLATAYNKEFTIEQIEVWYSLLGKYTVEEFSSAIQELIKKEKYLPSIAHITEQIAKSKLKDIPEAEEEWNKVINAVHSFGSYREQEALESLSSYTAKIVGYIGYSRICNAEADEQIWNKKEFIAEYNTLKDKEIINLQIENKERFLIGG